MINYKEFVSNIEEVKTIPHERVKEQRIKDIVNLLQAMEFNPDKEVIKVTCLPFFFASVQMNQEERVKFEKAFSHMLALAKGTIAKALNSYLQERKKSIDMNSLPYKTAQMILRDMETIHLKLTEKKKV